MTFEKILTDVEDRRRRLVVYSSVDDPDIVDQFTVRNVSIERRSLPGETAQGFVVVRDDEFVGSIGLEELRLLMEPPLAPPWDENVIGEAYRALYELLDDTLFVSLERRQLLGASRELENRAWNVGSGTLRAGFQRFSALETQLPVYTRLARDTDLEIHVYSEDEWQPTSEPGFTYHGEAHDDIGRFWFLSFDGDGDDRQMGALLAEERTPDEFFGFWTYDPALVTELSQIVEEMAD
ncbi:DICT sensory domain-containing protein [Natronoglomus mannanivorans]|uniref:Sensor protein n=1 Tax=Natronoglomus mannanivorans TaxID=2979990 RepID=A0AAP2YZQ5_9EURY|nr:sensor protein [Halobacteria archaeon AArc-xg1-1]